MHYGILPSELVDNIIRRATYVPGLLDEHVRYGFPQNTLIYTHFLLRCSSPFAESELLRTERLAKDLGRSEELKEIFVQVSNAWALLAIPLTMEYLSLQSDKEWETLPFKYAMSKFDSRYPYKLGAGAYVRRLDLDTFQWSKGRNTSAINMLKCCPKLEKLLVGSKSPNASPLPARVVKAVFEVPLAALHTLHFQSPLYTRSVRDVLERLPLTTSLRSLSLCFDHDSSRPLPVQTAELPHLESLDLVASNPAPVLLALARWSLPSLGHLSVSNSYHFANFDGARILPFFEAHGFKLTFLSLESVTITQDIFDACPNLSDLALSVRVALASRFARHPNLRRIGFRGFRDLEGNSVLAILISVVFDEYFPMLMDRTMFPLLRNIRLLDYKQDRFDEPAWLMSDIVRWSYWAEQSKLGGARLEDHNGDLVQPQAQIPLAQVPLKPDLDIVPSTILL